MRGGRRGGELPRPAGHRFGGGTFRRAGRDDDAPRRIRRRERRRRAGERLRRPAPERVAGADVQHDQRRRSIDAGERQALVDAAHRIRIERHRHGIARAIGRRRCRAARAAPIDSGRNGAAARATASTARASCSTSRGRAGHSRFAAARASPTSGIRCAARRENRSPDRSAPRAAAARARRRSAVARGRAAARAR